MDSLHELLIFLIAAVMVVPIFKYLGFGAVLGYLCAGIAIGPFGLNLISDVNRILHFAELGVVLLLFIIGLELKPSRLWALRNAIFVWGSIQMVVSAFLLSGIVMLLLKLSFVVSLLIGFTLSLSSTAFALQMLAERQELTKRHGRTAFAILLFQDIAVVPLLAILPILDPARTMDGQQFDWLPVISAVLVLLFILFAGRFLLRHFLRRIAGAEVREILTASTLLIVIGMGLILGNIGLSMALGAFMAGVLLADSEFRHQLEADIEPFKGLLLGLFFIAVGMSVNISLLREVPLQVFLATVLLVGIKATVLFLIGKRQGMDNMAAKSLALSISQGGEFAFVVFAMVLAMGLVESSIIDLLIVTVTLSMAVTPVLLKLDDYFAARSIATVDDFDTTMDEENSVIIAGFGRFGQITGRLLSARKIPFTALEISPEQVDFVRRFGNKIYYGDASRLDLLQAAHIDKAKILVLAIDDVEASLKTAEIVRHHFPKVNIYARARNRKHAYQLMDLGISIIRRETFSSALDIAGLVLEGLGMPRKQVKHTVETFRKHDMSRLYEHRSMHTDEDKMIALGKSASKELEEMFEQDSRNYDKSVSDR
jgi:monovalent cation:proton antiporter-2 (CPA2) family protein